MGKIHTRVKPIIAASVQAAGAFADTHVLFDWTKIDAARCSSIDGLQVIVGGTNGVAQTMVAIDLFFATSHTNIGNSAPGSMGDLRGAVDLHQWKNNLVAYVPITAGDFNDADLITLNIATKSGLDIPVGGDLYVAAIAKGALDFQGTVQCNGVQAITQAGLVVKTTSALINFAPGDVLHDESDRLIGTVQSVTDATNMVMTANLANATVADKDLYNLSPVQLVLNCS
tara:strand:- start:2807 stop:3490 length:684 start_codon:yes stop_codon:yes gene_type:complete